MLETASYYSDYSLHHGLHGSSDHHDHDGHGLPLTWWLAQIDLISQPTRSFQTTKNRTAFFVSMMAMAVAFFLLCRCAQKPRHSEVPTALDRQYTTASSSSRTPWLTCTASNYRLSAAFRAVEIFRPHVVSTYMHENAQCSYLIIHSFAGFRKA